MRKFQLLVILLAGNHIDALVPNMQYPRAQSSPPSTTQTSINGLDVRGNGLILNYRKALISNVGTQTQAPIGTVERSSNSAGGGREGERRERGREGGERSMASWVSFPQFSPSSASAVGPGERMPPPTGQTRTSHSAAALAADGGAQAGRRNDSWQSQAPSPDTHHDLSRHEDRVRLTGSEDKTWRLPPLQPLSSAGHNGVGRTGGKSGSSGPGMESVNVRGAPNADMNVGKENAHYSQPAAWNRLLGAYWRSQSTKSNREVNLMLPKGFISSHMMETFTDTTLPHTLYVQLMCSRFSKEDATGGQSGVRFNVARLISDLDTNCDLKIQLYEGSHLDHVTLDVVGWLREATGRYGQSGQAALAMFDLMDMDRSGYISRLDFVHGAIDSNLDGAVTVCEEMEHVTKAARVAESYGTLLQSTAAMRNLNSRYGDDGSTRGRQNVVCITNQTGSDPMVSNSEGGGGNHSSDGARQIYLQQPLSSVPPTSTSLSVTERREMTPAPTTRKERLRGTTTPFPPFDFDSLNVSGIFKVQG